jgi:ribonuclease P/MRP protein subunit RPP1
VNKRIEKTHVNILDSLLPRLREQEGVLYLKRLNIILDEDSEKGFGLVCFFAGNLWFANEFYFL